MQEAFDAAFLQSLIQLLQEILRRSVDGTVVPLVADYTNQRVLIGAMAATTSNVGKVEVTGGDIKLVTASKGLILRDANSVEYRLYMDIDGAIRADKL